MSTGARFDFSGTVESEILRERKRLAKWADYLFCHGQDSQKWLSLQLERLEPLWNECRATARRLDDMAAPPAAPVVSLQAYRELGRRNLTDFVRIELVKR